MESPAYPKNEIERLNALVSYSILDTPAERAFDDFTYLATQICGTPIALITLLDENRQWFKSKVGIDGTETARDISFCGHAILQDELFEIHNALEDERFKDNPLVTGYPFIRFYAGMPLITKSGYNLGTLCVIDKVPRELEENQRASLKILARQVRSQIEYRVNTLHLANLNDELTEYKMQEQQRLADEFLQRDALVREVHHRIKNNLQSVASLLSNFSAQYPELSAPINAAVTQVKSIAIIHGLQGRFANGEVKLSDLVTAIAENNRALWNIALELDIPTDWPLISIAEKEAVPLALVLNELILNAIKHSDNSSKVSISLSHEAEEPQHILICIRNPGKLVSEPAASNQDADTPTFGTGLQLVTSLLPKKNSRLSWRQSGDIVLTQIVLSAPIILIK